jgi:endo-1,4-beta-xylanase
MRVVLWLGVGLGLLGVVPSAWAQGKAKAAKQANSDEMWVTEVGEPLPTGVTHHTYYSPSMRREVGYCVYLPPGYAAHPERRYPVIYNLHGAGGNELRTVHSAVVLQEGILAKRWPEMIIVFPNGGRSTMYQDSADGRFMAETTVIHELIPHVDRSYRTIADRRGRCIEGFSMGGRGSTHLAMKYPQLFGSLFNQAGNVYRVSDASQLPNPYLGSDPERLRANDPYVNLAKNLAYIQKNLPIQIGCGTADMEHLISIREFRKELLKLEVPHLYFEVEGLDHNQKKMIAGRQATWFDFHIDSLKKYGVELYYHAAKGS